jgi:hypothetical protein
MFSGVRPGLMVPGNSIMGSYDSGSLLGSSSCVEYPDAGGAKMCNDDCFCPRDDDRDEATDPTNPQLFLTKDGTMPGAVASFNTCIGLVTEDTPKALDRSGVLKMTHAPPTVTKADCILPAILLYSLL